MIRVALFLVGGADVVFHFASCWDVPIYVVGAKTAFSFRAAVALDNDDPSSIDIRGQDSGNAAELGKFILEDVRGLSSVKMLYLMGDRNRDTVVRVLGEGGVGLETLRVYETQACPEFERRLGVVLEAAPKGLHVKSILSLCLSISILTIAQKTIHSGGSSTLHPQQQAS